jgi:peptide/nickel transport system permease protein
MAQAIRRRSTFLSGFRKTARLYLKSKIGVTGLIIIAFFVILAVFAPLIDSNNPVFAQNLGAPLSVPSWATIFPQYAGYAVTGNPVPQIGFATPAAVEAWALSGVANGNVTRAVSSAVPPARVGKFPGSMQLNASIIPNQQNTTSEYLPGGQVFFSLSYTFQWTTKPPNTFQVNMLFDPLEMENVSAIYLNYIISTPKENFSLSTVQAFGIKVAIDYPSSQTEAWTSSAVSSFSLTNSGLPGFSNIPAGTTIFGQHGTYKLVLQVLGVPTGARSSISMDIASLYFQVQGNAYGVLGTDNLGRDVWSQFVWGSQISLLIGIASGIGAVALGTLAGVAAGYLGGMSDEILSRVTDFVLVLPFLPLLIIIVLILSQNPVLYSSIYFWVVMVFTLISWPSIAKIIRSQVLSVKERQYVEASRAVGGGTGHILRRHILPNVMGLVYSQIALNVSGFILLEAALDFLAVSLKPTGVMTWGVMLTNALPYATSDATASYVWWWFLPPGISIAALSLAFVLVGFALDSVFNPKLRAR